MRYRRIIQRTQLGTGLIGLSLLASGAAAANELVEVRFERANGGGDFVLNLSDNAPAPRVFSVGDPPQLVVELPDTTTELPARAFRVNTDVVRSYSTHTDGENTRMLVRLADAADYSADRAGNQVVVHIEPDADTTTAVADAGRQQSGAVAEVGSEPDSEPASEPESQPEPRQDPRAERQPKSQSQRQSQAEQPANRPSTLVNREVRQLRDIDFRRTRDGAGRVLLDLGDTEIDHAVSERGNRIQYDLSGVRVAESLRTKTLDVTDFATPVEQIEASQSGANARLSLTVSGVYEHRTLKRDGTFVIEVYEPEAEAEEDQPQISFFQDKEYTGERVTFNFQDIPVRSVLSLIADVSDLNIVVSDSVTGNVTLRLEDVPWDQALDIVLDAKNLDKRRNGSVIWVAPAQEIASREQQLLQAAREKQTLEPLQTMILDISYAEATNLAELLRETSDTGDDRGLLSQRGSVSVDSRTNTLLVTDTPDRLQEIQSLVERLDRPVRQVLIESRIVVATDDFSHDLGVRFGVTHTEEDDSGNVFTTTGSLAGTDQMNNLVLRNRLARGNSGSAFPNFADNPEDGSGILVPSLNNRLNVNLPAANPAGRLGFSVLAADYLLDLELSALESEGQGEVISTPRVVTANQAEAFIQQGVEIPFQQSTSSGATSIQFREAVLELRAVPLITPDNRIQLDLSVSQDTVGQVVPTGNGGTAPSIDTREVSTEVLVENGQTIVLGGIFQEDIQYNNEKVPVLGDIPALGALFRRRSTENDKTELLIFVTPTILDQQTTLNR